MTVPDAAPLDILRTGPADDPTEAVVEWMNRPALRALVEGFGGDWPTGRLVEQVKCLVEFSEVWNRRSGSSRLDIVDGGTVMPAADIICGAEELGLVTQPPITRDKYDVVLVLGGLVTGCPSRVEALRAQFDAGLDVGAIALLGSFRELYPDEREMAEAEAGAHAATEVALLTEFAQRYPGGGSFSAETLGDPVLQPRLASRHGIRTAAAGSGRETGIAALPLHVFASASSEPDVRPANTMDTYVQAASALEMVPGQEILLITTRIYRYQHLDAVRGLVRPYGVTVETYGTDLSSSRRDFGAVWYLQEVRSMLLSIRRLLDDLSSPPVQQ